MVAGSKDLPDIKSLIAKMQIYNATEDSFKEAVREAADAGVNPLRHGAVVEYLRKSGQQDLADYVEGIGESGFRGLLSHYGVIGEQEGGEAEVPAVPPTGEEIFAAMLDAFEQDVNLGDKRKLVKWMRDNQHEGVARWLEVLDRADFFRTLSKFFGNLGRVRERLPAEMSQSISEQVIRPEVPPSGKPPEERPEEEPEEMPPKPPDLNAIIMDAYLEGVDVSRRSQLVKELDKGGYEESAEFIDSLSLSDFYKMLAEFFSGLAKALEESDGRSAMRRLTEQADPRREWLWMSASERAEAMMAGGIPPDEADLFGGYDWHELPEYVQKAFRMGLAMVTERRKRAEIELPFRRGKMSKMFSKLEAPEELLPAEIEEAVRVAERLCGEFGLEEASKRAAKEMGEKKGMPESVVADLERFLRRAMQETLGQETAPAPVTSKVPGKEIKPTDEKPEKKVPETTKEEISPEAREFISRKIRILRREGYPQKQAVAIAYRMARDAGYKVPEPSEGYDADGSECPEDEPSKVSEEILGYIRRLALMPSRFMGESKVPPPKAVLIEASTSGGGGSGVAPSGVSGAPGVGILDVFSYGGYLEKTLPYLIASTVSRMDEEDRVKFVNTFRKFVETNDIVHLTRLAGNLADIVEWGDASQEGAELVKTFRFLSDFLNMMKASVDYTKKAISV